MSHHRDFSPSFPIPPPKGIIFLILSCHKLLSFSTPPPPPPLLMTHRTEQADSLWIFANLNFKGTNLKGHLSPFNYRKRNCLYYGMSGWRVSLPNEETPTSTQTKWCTRLSCSVIIFIFPLCYRYFLFYGP